MNLSASLKEKGYYTDGKNTWFPDSIVRNKEISSSAFRLLLCLCSHDPCNPTYQTLQRQTGLCQATIASSLKKLAKMGFVKYNEGDTCNNFYEIDLRSVK